MEIGAQLYTVRDHCKTLEDFAETLKKIADIGYRCVQVSGTCPYPADWLRDQLTRNGLRCVLTHIPVPRLTGDAGYCRFFRKSPFLFFRDTSFSSHRPSPREFFSAHSTF